MIDPQNSLSNQCIIRVSTELLDNICRYSRTDPGLAGGWVGERSVADSILLHPQGQCIPLYYR